MTYDRAFARAQIVDIAQKIVAGEIRPLLGARLLSRHVNTLQGEINRDCWRTIVGVDSESDGLPIGPERQYWASEALREKDKLAGEYEQKVAADVLCAAQELLIQFSTKQ